MNQQNRVFYGPRPVQTSTAEPLLPHVADLNQTGSTGFTLDTGTESTAFAIEMPGTCELVSVIDLDALGIDLTSTYVERPAQEDGTRRYLMQQAVPYSESHRHQVSVAYVAAAAGQPADEPEAAPMQVTSTDEPQEWPMEHSFTDEWPYIGGGCIRATYFWQEGVVYAKTWQCDTDRAFFSPETPETLRGLFDQIRGGLACHTQLRMVYGGRGWTYTDSHYYGRPEELLEKIEEFVATIKDQSAKAFLDMVHEQVEKARSYQGGN